MKKLKPDLVEVDPIFPILAGTGLPPLKEGEGKSLFKTTKPTRVVELPYRAFYVMWEQAERLAARNYPHYQATLPRVADTWLEAVVAFRNAALENPLEVMTEEEAAKMRKRWLRAQEKAAEKTKSKKAGKGGKSKSKAAESNPEPSRVASEDLCGAKHKAPDGKTRKCIRKPHQNGKHKDKKGNRF